MVRKTMVQKGILRLDMAGQGYQPTH